MSLGQKEALEAKKSYVDRKNAFKKGLGGMSFMVNKKVKQEYVETKSLEEQVSILEENLRLSAEFGLKLKKENKKLTKQVETLKLKREAHHKKIKKKNAKIKDFRQQAETAQEELRLKKEELTVTQTELEELSKAMKEISQEVNDSQRLIENNSELRKLNSKFQNEIAEMKEKSNTTVIDSKAMEKLKKEKETLLKKNRELSKKLSKETEIKEDLQAKLAELESQSVQKEVTIKRKMSKKFDKVKSRNESLKSELSTFQMSLNTMEDKWKSDLAEKKRLDSVKNKLQVELENARLEKTNLESENANLKRKLRKNKVELSKSVKLQSDFLSRSMTLENPSPRSPKTRTKIIYKEIIREVPVEVFVRDGKKSSTKYKRNINDRCGIPLIIWSIISNVIQFFFWGLMVAYIIAFFSINEYVWNDSIRGMYAFISGVIFLCVIVIGLCNSSMSIFVSLINYFADKNNRGSVIFAIINVCVSVVIIIALLCGLGITFGLIIDGVDLGYMHWSFLLIQVILFFFCFLCLSWLGISLDVIRMGWLEKKNLQKKKINKNEDESESDEGHLYLDDVESKKEEDIKIEVK